MRQTFKNAVDAACNPLDSLLFSSAHVCAGMEHDPGYASRLLEFDDFKKAYELNAAAYEELKEAGLSPDFGNGGMEPQDWPDFGSVVKTMTEFKTAYDAFKARTVEFVKKVAEGE